MPNENQNRRGMRMLGKTIFGSHLMRKAIEEMVNCFYSPTITLKTRNADGSNTDRSPAEIKMGPTGWTAEIDLTNLGPYGGATGQTIYPGLIYNIENLTNPANSSITFQIRDLIVGYRAKLSLAITGGTSPRFNNILGANYETLFEVIQDGQGIDTTGPNSQPTANTGGDIRLQLLTDVAIAPGQQIVFADITGLGAIDNQASFFVQITDDGTNLYAQIFGRMWNNNGRPETQQTPWPTGENIIALGSVRVLGTPFYDQVQVGNAVNRYPNLTANNRGRWLTDNLSGQIFYFNDTVLDDTTGFGVVDGQAMYYVWQYTGTVSQEVNEPSFFGAPWKKLYAILLP